MVTLEEVSDLEQQYLPPNCKPTLGRALELLWDRWEAMKRDKETALRLLFLAWYVNVEPPFLTGFSDDLDSGEIFQRVFIDVGGANCPEAEILFAVGTLCLLAPWSIGPEEKWRAIGEECLDAARKLGHDSYAADHFRHRGVYGDYFARLVQAREEGKEMTRE